MDRVVPPTISVGTQCQVERRDDGNFYCHTHHWFFKLSIKDCPDYSES
jgi:hypothetical protein